MNCTLLCMKGMIFMNEGSGDHWIPRLSTNLVIGPNRWNGKQMVSDIAITGQERIIQIGLLERCILEAVDGHRSVADIYHYIGAQNLKISEEKITAVLNKFAFFGIVNRPFALRRGTQDEDNRAMLPPQVQSDQIPLSGHRFSLLTLWKHDELFNSKFGFPLILICGVGSILALVVLFPAVMSTLRKATWLQWAIGVLIAICWNSLVTILHENSHASLFYRESSRIPFLALMKMGFLIMPNTHMPGFSLLRTGAKVRIAAIGPLTSLSLMFVPVLFYYWQPDSWIGVISAISIGLGTIIILLSCSPLPNTDMTRLIEALIGVDQIQQVATYSMTGKYKVPGSLPLRTRIGIRIYPLLLLLTVVCWAAAVVWAIWLVFH